MTYKLGSFVSFEESSYTEYGVIIEISDRVPDYFTIFSTSGVVFKEGDELEPQTLEEIETARATPGIPANQLRDFVHLAKFIDSLVK